MLMSPQARTTAAAVLATCFAMNLLARGASETFAVFLLPLEQEFQSSRSQLTGIYSVFMLVHGIAAPVMGSVFDRYGPRISYGVGLACFALAYLLAARAQSLWQLTLSLGALVGIGAAALSMVTASGLIARWFRGRLGTAMGLAYAGYGVGVMLLVPASQMLIARHGWRDAYNVLGIALLLCVPVFLALPWTRWSAGRDARATASAGAWRTPWTLRAAARDGAFWGLFAVFFFTAAAIYSTTVQAVVYLVDTGFTALQAATAFGAIGVLSTAGMGSAGWLADRIGRRRSVAISFSLTIAGVIMLMALSRAPGLWLLGTAVFCFGLSAGSRGPVISTLAAELFPGGGLGAIFGAVTLGMGMGAALGSWASGALFDVTGNYLAGFLFATATAALGLAQFWLVPALRSGRRSGPG
jgi:MFS family permease